MQDAIRGPLFGQTLSERFLTQNSILHRLEMSRNSPGLIPVSREIKCKIEPFWPFRNDKNPTLTHQDLQEHHRKKIYFYFLLFYLFKFLQETWGSRQNSASCLMGTWLNINTRFRLHLDSRPESLYTKVLNGQTGWRHRPFRLHLCGKSQIIYGRCRRAAKVNFRPAVMTGRFFVPAATLRSVQTNEKLHMSVV